MKRSLILSVCLSCMLFIGVTSCTILPKHMRSEIVNAPPLFQAIAMNKLDRFKQLLQQGVNPNDPAKVHISYFGSGVSVMEMAAYCKNPSFLREALAHGGDPNFPVGIDGRTLLWAAADNLQWDNFRILMDAGADLNHQRSNGATILLDLVLSQKDIAYELLQRGADPTIKNEFGNHVPTLLRKQAMTGIEPGPKELASHLKIVAELRRRGLL